MDGWTRYLTAQFRGSAAHPVSNFDPSGFVLVVSVLLLVVGAVISSTRWLLFSKDGRELREQVEKSLHEVQDFVDDHVEEHLEIVRQHVGRQGFIAEMLSPAYLSRLAFAVLAMLVTSYLNALAAVIAGCVRAGMWWNGIVDKTYT